MNFGKAPLRISNILDDVLEKVGFYQIKEEKRIRDNWPKLVGERMAEIAQVHSFRENKLYLKIENPVCPKCNKHMKSKGTNQGYKCIKCGTKSNKPIVQEMKRNIKTGLYEVPVCARRHLSKPIERVL